ncbi:MAG: dioxygenase family protein, partial [Rhodobacterales bacterium]
VVIEGLVRSTENIPIEGAVIELWQTATNGLYSNQDPVQPDYNLRCSMTVGKDGRYAITTVKPAPYKIPDDGPVGDLLRATGRNAWRPSHLHFIIQAAGYKSLVTEVFSSDDPYLNTDAVFGVRDDLVMDYQECTNLEELPDDLSIGRDVTVPFYKVDFDFVLVPE